MDVCSWYQENPLLWFRKVFAFIYFAADGKIVSCDLPNVNAKWEMLLRIAK